MEDIVEHQNIQKEHMHILLVLHQYHYQPVFPYFIGDTYRSNPVIDNYKLTQKDFDIENSNLIRNTYPYKVSDQFADNDFIVESNEISLKHLFIESTSFGSVDSIQIINDGDNYRVGNSASFDNTDTKVVV